MAEETISQDMWVRLKRSTSNAKRHLGGRLLVADSKKAYNRSSTAGIRYLQRTTLAMLRCCGGDVFTLGQLLERLCPDAVERLKGYPWYRDAGAEQLGADGADIGIAANALANDMADNGISCIGVSSRCLDVAHYNRMVENVRNKANVLFSATCGLIAQALERADCECVQVVVDRQGGRVHYRQALLRMFGDMELTILKETPRSSSYELKGRGKRMRVHFAVGADDKYWPVSLSSMVSKYLREVLVSCLNNYFGSFHADLKPTAGYWTDGLRFINDIKQHLPDLQYDSNQLVRSR